MWLGVSEPNLKLQMRVNELAMCGFGATAIQCMKLNVHQDRVYQAHRLDHSCAVS